MSPASLAASYSAAVPLMAWPDFEVQKAVSPTISLGPALAATERPRETLVVRERKATGLRVTVKADMFSWSGFAEGAGRCAAQGMSSRGKFQWKSSWRRRGRL